MSLRTLVGLPTSLLALLSLAPLARCECYVAAYGLIGKQDGWLACPGTATSSGGAESCCLPGSQCGDDSICHVPASQDPGNNAWYVAGCTDSSYEDSVCNNICVRYTQTYIQYEDSDQKWMCCGDGGCNGTVTDATFSAVSPGDWKVITGSSAASTATTPTSAVSTNKVTSTNSNPGLASTTPSGSNIVTSGSNAMASKESTTTSRTAAITSGDFKPSPLGTSSGAGVSATTGSDTSNAPQNSNGDNNSDSGLSTGAKAGIGVAIGIAGLALIVGLIAIFMLRRNRKSKEMDTDEVRMKVDHAPPHSSYAAPPYSSSSTYGTSTVSELPTNPAVFEVGGAENEVRNKYWRPW